MLREEPFNLYVLEKKLDELPSNFRGDVRSLMVELEMLTSVFESDGRVPEDWAIRVRELAHDIEDWVDLFAIRVDAPSGGSKPSSSRLLRWLPRYAHKPMTLPTDELRVFRTRADLLRGQNLRLPLSRFVSRPVDSRLTTPVIDTGDLVGLDGPIEEVANMVMDAGYKARLKVVSIVGMAGSGKTTLANAVYERLGGHNCFQCHAFVSVDHNLGRKKTLTEMLSNLTNGHQVEVDEDIRKLIERIREILHNERYLIVVDDLWSEQDWEIVHQCFPENSLGSRIITTTRNIALATESHSIYNIGLLGETDSRKLILNRAFGTEHGCPQDLEYFFPQITRRCGGLPLALVTVASMFTDQSSMGKWERLFGSTLLWTSDPDAEMMKRSLDLSYNDLPLILRTCLLYLSIFPVYCEVEVERLAMFWIAEGFIIAEGRRRSVEETARYYLSELISRNMVQPLHLNHDGTPRYCILHPVIHDFIVCKSLEQNFVALVNDQDHQCSPNNNGIVRRLSLQRNINRNNYTDLSHARSISVFGQASFTPPLTYLKRVRVLDLEGCDGPVCLDGLSAMQLLRYLSLRNTDVSELPATIRELMCLQILDVRSTKLKELPPSIGALLHLRYLNIRDTDVRELPATIGKLRYLETLDARSTKVKELPPSIVKLKHTLKSLLVSSKGTIDLIETSTRIPQDIYNCQRLEKLGIIDIREHHASNVKTLGGLNRLRVLKVTWSTQQSSERAYREALLSSINEWSNLESLTIHCGFLCSMEFLNSTNPPHRLKKFKVTAGKFAVVPRWFHGLIRLSFLQITVCKLGSDDLSILTKLPELKCLILGLEFIPRAAIVIENEGFNELTRISIDCPVPWLSFRAGAMPKVEYLQLNFCSGSAGPESVPSGIINLRSITEVVLCYNEKWCSNSSSVKMTVVAVKEQVSTHRNPIKLIINGTIVNVQQAQEATEIHNEAESGGKDKDDVGVAGDGTSKITSEIEEIEDDTQHKGENVILS